MLYNNKKETPKKRLYEHLYVHTASNQVFRLQKKGKVMLNGQPKQIKE